MRFENARAALQHAKTFHQQLGDFYHSLSPQVTQPKAKLLLDYIINGAITSLGGSARHCVRSTYIVWQNKA